MTHYATSPARRARRLETVACAFAFLAAIFVAPTLAEGIAVCPECGRESSPDASFCSHCGAALSAAQDADAHATEAELDAGKGGLVGKGEPAQSSPNADGIVSGAKAAARDWAEARRRRSAGDAAAAFAIFRNAQALLAAGAGPAPEAKATRAMAAEAEAVRLEFVNAFSASKRQAAAAAGMRSAETYFRGEGRVRFGSAWIPAGWVQALPPPSLASIRLSIPPFCAECAGSGLIPCRTCAGKGTVPCKADGCHGGYVTRKPTNSLTPSTDISIREKCPVCRGTSRVSCAKCAGRGGTPCRKCGGTGDAPVCAGCAGTGLQDCRQCLKSGIDPACQLCAGSGKVLCGKCGGDGRISR